MRISKAAILSFPYRWKSAGDEHAGIDKTTIAKWTLHIRPETVMRAGGRIIYFFKF